MLTLGFLRSTTRKRAFPHRLGGRRSRFLQLEALETRALLSITLDFDYTYDSSNFFDTQAKRDVLQAAGKVIASELNDNLLAIEPSGSNTWSEVFANPSTGSQQTVTNPTVPADTLVIYVGGRVLGGTESGFGGTGGYNDSGTPAWLNTVGARGQAGALVTPPTNYGPWGGSIAFDDGSTNWYFGVGTSGLASNQTDFFTVAQHELGHVLGIGTSASWMNDIIDDKFTGANAVAADGGEPVPLDPAGSHWAEGTTSGGQTAVMTPVLQDGTRLIFTPLDFAGLADIGWQLQPTSTSTTLQFSQATYTVSETGGSIVIPVTREGGGSGAVSVQFNIGGGSAVAGVDYTAVNETMSWADGDASTKDVVIPILDNVNAARNLTVNFALGAPTGGAMLGTPSTGTLTITATPGGHDNIPFPPLVTITSLTVPTIEVIVGKGRKARRKPESVIELHLSGALSGAGNLAAYRLLSGKSRKGVTTFKRRVPLSSAVYNAATLTVTLFPVGKLNLSIPEQLRVTAALLNDAYGRPLAGGLDFSALIRKRGIT